MPSLPINTNTDGATLVAAPGSRQFIRIIGMDLTAEDQVEVSLKSDSTIIWGPTYAMNDPNVLGGLALNVSKERTIDCLPGQALKIGLSAAVLVGGSIEYIVQGPPQ